MRTMTQAELISELDAALASAANLDNPVLIQRGGEEHDVVIVSDRDFRGMVTTIELLSDPVRAAELLASIAELDRARDTTAHAAE